MIFLLGLMIFFINGWALHDSFAASCCFSLKGEYLITTFDSTGETIVEQEHSDFVFQRDGIYWNVEVLNHQATPSIKKYKWLYYDGAIFHTICHNVDKPDSIERSMVITEDKYPDLSWVYPTAILLFFAPDYVISGDPPSIPTLVYDGMVPDRVNCEYELFEKNEFPTLKNLKVFDSDETSLFDPASNLNIPLVRFSCDVSDEFFINDSVIPVKFNWKYFGGSTINDVYIREKIDYTVDLHSIEFFEPGFLKPTIDEGKTLVLDTRVKVGDYYLNYMASSNILEPGSEAANEFIAITGAKITDKSFVNYFPIFVMGLLTLLAGWLSFKFLRKNNGN